MSNRESGIMKLKKGLFCVCTIFVLLFVSMYAKAQNTRAISVTDSSASIDTIPLLNIDQMELERLPDIRKQFEIQNATYSVPIRPTSDLLRFLKKDEPTLSPEALYWARLVRDASTIFDHNMTFRDTIIADPIFLTPLFRGNVLSDDLTFYKNVTYSENKDPYAVINKLDTTLFADYYKKKKKEEELQKYLETTQLNLFDYSVGDLPGESVPTKVIRRSLTENVSLKATPEIVNPDDLDAPTKFIPDRQYWRSAFESAIQFSQAYVSHNWHKGGSSNINLFTKNYVKYDYNKDKVQFTNELEVKVSFYNAPKDTLRDYKVGDDKLRYHANLGYKAFNKWYYTLDGQFETALFKHFQENADMKQVAFLSPLSINLGVGMKYSLSKAYKTKHKNLKLSVNLAPFSYSFLYSVKNDLLMDLARHGFEKKEDPVEGENPYERSLSRIGSTVQADMTMNFNRNISWQSRFYYFTSYETVKAEFENTLTLAITRHFSTRIYFYLRYDDSVGPGKKDTDLGYFQINELLSFGFNYKW